MVINCSNGVDRCLYVNMSGYHIFGHFFCCWVFHLFVLVSKALKCKQFECILVESAKPVGVCVCV